MERDEEKTGRFSCDSVDLIVRINQTGHIIHGQQDFCVSLFLVVSTLQSWQQTPWAHSAPAFRVQLLALQQGLVHSYTYRVAERRVMSPGKNIQGKYILHHSRDTTHTHLFFSTVTFFSILQVTIATALASIHGSSVWQVKETLPSSRAQVALQLLLVTSIKHTWKGMPVPR